MLPDDFQNVRTIRLDGRDVTQVPTQERGVGVVFQNYSIFQHMTVAENIGFGLQMLGKPKAEVAKTTAKMLAMVLHGVFTRHPELKVASVENGSDWVFTLVKQIGRAHV